MNKNLEELKLIIDSYEGLELDRIDVEVLKGVVDYINQLQKQLHQKETVIDKVKILLAELAITSTWDKQKEINEVIKILESKEDNDGRIHYKKYD